jgi:nucleotide sugar dehydrogenase
MFKGFKFFFSYFLNMKKNISISIIGSGVVGTIVGEGFSKIGYSVIFYDVDKKRIDFLSKKGYKTTLSLRYALTDSDISFISVPTPLSNLKSPHGYRKMDLSYIENVTKEIAKVLKEKDDYHTITIKSTVLPTTAEKVVIPILKREELDKKVDVCVNPEFLTEIAETWDSEKKFVKGFFNEDRHVIGEQTPNSRGGNLLEELYTQVNAYSGNNVPIERVSLKEASWTKLVANAALACKISYFNNLFEPAQKLGINPHKTAKIVGLDKRIGVYGTIHGKAFGGKCLPKDLEAFLAFLDEEVGYVPILLDAIYKVNVYMAEHYGVRE